MEPSMHFSNMGLYEFSWGDTVDKANLEKGIGDKHLRSPNTERKGQGTWKRNNQQARENQEGYPWASFSLFSKWKEKRPALTTIPETFQDHMRHSRLKKRIVT